MFSRSGSYVLHTLFLTLLLAAASILSTPANAQDDQVIKIGAPLALTGGLADEGKKQQIAYQMWLDKVNAAGGIDVGGTKYKVELITYDYQTDSKLAAQMTEKLITGDKVNLIMGPYATAPILAAMGVAQRYGKVMIQSSMGIPKLQTYDMAFPATPFGPEPDKTYPNVILDCMATLPTPPKSMVIVTSKFPSAQFMAQGMRTEAEKRGVKVALYLEYESGNRDFGAIAARVKEANADFLWVGSLGLESNQLLEALRKLDYTAKTSFHLYPAPGPLALSPDGNLVWSSTFLEPDEPFMSRPGMKKIAELYKERAAKANLPYSTIDAQATGMVVAWQILEAGVNGAKSLEDKQIAAWLKKNVVDTVYGPTKFDGLYNHGAPAQLIRQVQDKQWKVVWPKQFVAPGVRLIAT
jgi:branched-chain amino acid transport system substrate-binding protein